MSKTYSVCFQNKRGDWITNWYTYFHLDEIDWKKVAAFARQRGDQAYGYMFGNKSNTLTAARCRTEVKRYRIKP